MNKATDGAQVSLEHGHPKAEHPAPPRITRASHSQLLKNDINWHAFLDMALAHDCDHKARIGRLKVSTYRNPLQMGLEGRKDDVQPRGRRASWISKVSYQDVYRLLPEARLISWLQMSQIGESAVIYYSRLLGDHRHHVSPCKNAPKLSSLQTGPA